MLMKRPRPSKPQTKCAWPGVPFAPGTDVEVTISVKRRSGEEFAAAWQRVCTEMRRVQKVTDKEIQSEIADYRAGRSVLATIASDAQQRRRHSRPMDEVGKVVRLDDVL
jgi:hypothetical protein